MKQISKLILTVLLCIFTALNLISAQTPKPSDETLSQNREQDFSATNAPRPQQSPLPTTGEIKPQSSTKPPVRIPSGPPKNTDLPAPDFKNAVSPTPGAETINSKPLLENNNPAETQPTEWQEELKDFLWKLIDTIIGVILGLIARITLALLGLMGILFVAFFGLLWWFWRKGWITRALQWYSAHPFWSLLVAFIFLVLAALLLFFLPEGAAFGLIVFVLLLALLLILGGITLCLLVIWNLGIKPLWNWLTKAWQKLKGICKIWFPIAEMVCRQWDEHMEKICDEWEKTWQCDKWEEKWQCDEYEKEWRCDEYEKEWRCSSWHWSLRWLCLLGEWVSTGVCKIGQWVSTGICKLGKWISTGLCLLGKWVMTGLCKLFHWVSVKVCRLWVRIIRWVAE